MNQTNGRSNGRPAALIAGGHFLSLGATRNLARYDVPVYLVDSEICVTQFSRSVKRSFQSPPVSEERRFVEFLVWLADEADLHGAVLFPSADEYVRVLARNHDCLSQYYRLTVPPWEKTRYLYDKRLTSELARRQNVPIPATYNPTDLKALQALALEYPVVLKPAVSTHLSAVTKKKAYRADTPEELVELYTMIAGIIDPAEILVQELIPGRAETLYSCFGLFAGGEPVAASAARRPRQHPMDFGRASTLVETVDLPELTTLATRFLRGIEYTGLAEVEFMYDRKHERFELIEVNPRIWGWHSIAIAAGVDLPYLTYQLALGSPTPGGSFRAGVRWVRMITDLPTVANEIWHGRMSVGAYMQSLRGCNEAVFAASDPLPSLVELALIPYYMKRRGF